jgi:hypothetical protein
MPTPNTYTGLVSAVVDLAEDDSTEFASYIPTAIFLAEERLVKEVDTHGVKAVTTVTAVSGSALIAKPTGYRLTHEIFFITSVSGSAVIPEYKNLSFIKDYWPKRDNTGVVKYIGDYDASSWILAPTPQSDYVFTIEYTKSPTKLTAAASTNYFTDSCPDALFYATMVHMSEFMKDYQTAQLWEAKYQTAVQTLNNEGRRSRRGDSNAPNNPVGTLNTLTGGV